MGNNLQAFQTAKALTKQISSNEPYVTTNGAKDVEIPRRLNSRPSLSPTAVAGVTLKPSSHRSDSSVKDLMTNGSKNEYIYQNGSSLNHDRTNPFVYYLPQTNGIYTQPQDESIHDRIDTQRHVTESRGMVTSQAEMTYTTQAHTADQTGTAKPVVVDLTLDDSDDNDEQQNTSQPENTFPKILAAYSLNAENTGFPNLSSLISRKVTESQENNIIVDSLVLNTTKPNGSFIESTSLNLNKPYKTVETSALDASPFPLISTKHNATVAQPLRTKPNGFFLDNRFKTCDPHDQRPSYPKNGLRNYSNDIDTRVLTNHVRTGNVRNEVMLDVTNTHGAQSYEYRPLLFSGWNKTTETRPPVTTTSDAEDNVVITKVVTPTDKSRDRPKQRRKAPLQVRQWCFEEQDKQIDESTEKTHVENGSSELCSSQRLLEMGRKDTEKPAQRSTSSPNNLHRESKIRTLKNLLAKQEKALEKMRTQDNSKCPLDRMLVVEIPDLKSELHLPNAEKHSFRVCSKTITISPKNDSPRKRPRKRDPRKINRQEDRYPSYVEASDDDHVASKRFKGKQKVGRKPRGRNSPKPTNQIPVVLKDLWHRELEKVEQQLALSGGPVDQTSFMMFLGLKKV